MYSINFLTFCSFWHLCRLVISLSTMVVQWSLGTSVFLRACLIEVIGKDLGLHLWERLAGNFLNTIFWSLDIFYNLRIFDIFSFSNFLSRMAPEVLQPGAGYNFKYVNIACLDAWKKPWFFMDSDGIASYQAKSSWIVLMFYWWIYVLLFSFDLDKTLFQCFQFVVCY
jgi:hypothetical protein